MHASTRSTKGNCVGSLPSSSPAVSLSRCSQHPSLCLGFLSLLLMPFHTAAAVSLSSSPTLEEFSGHQFPEHPQHRAWGWEILAPCVHIDPVTQSSWETQLLTIHDSSIVSVTQSTVPWEESQWETVSIRLAFGCV